MPASLPCRVTTAEPIWCSAMCEQHIVETLFEVHGIGVLSHDIAHGELVRVGVGEVRPQDELDVAVRYHAQQFAVVGHRQVPDTMGAHKLDCLVQ